MPKSKVCTILYIWDYIVVMKRTASWQLDTLSGVSLKNDEITPPAAEYRACGEDSL